MTASLTMKNHSLRNTRTSSEILSLEQVWPKTEFDQEENNLKEDLKLKSYMKSQNIFVENLR